MFHALLLAATVSPLNTGAFDYNATAPLNVTTQSSSVSGKVRTSAVTFSSGGRTIQGEIVAPARPSGKPGPGVLFVHWLGDPSTTNHKEFDADARALARRGATCVLVDANWSTVYYAKKDWFGQVRTTENDYKDSIAQVVDLRRGLDVLVGQPGVDPKQIAYVGHDFGSMYGAVLAGVDPRPKWYVLMAGVPTFSQWFLLGKKPADVAAYEAQMAPLDPTGYLARSTAKGFLFQFAAHDEYVSAKDRDAFVDAAPLPRGTFLYDAKHDLKVPLATQDRMAWLIERLW